MPTTAPTPSTVLARRLLEVRNRLGWSQAEVASRMAEYGYSWDRTTVAKIERPGGRQVNVDELVSLAWVLGVSPVALLTPLGLSDTVAVLPNQEEVGPNIWRWMTGTAHRGGRHAKEIVTPDVSAEEVRFYNDAKPDYITTAEAEFPGMQRAIHMLSAAQSLAGYSDFDTLDSVDQALEETAELVRSLRKRVSIKRKAKS